MTNKENLKAIYKKFEETTVQIADEFIKELKKDSTTYRDVYKKIDSIKNEILYTHRVDQHVLRVFIGFIDCISQMLEEEKNDLPPTNRS